MQSSKETRDLQAVEQSSDIGHGAGAPAVDPGQYCPNCSMKLLDRGCKLKCPQCGFYLSCSDFF